jgi:hypothetical protein
MLLGTQLELLKDNTRISKIGLGIDEMLFSFIISANYFKSLALVFTSR